MNFTINITLEDRLEGSTHMKELLLIILAVRPSGHRFDCGNVLIARTKECLCGDTIITAAMAGDDKGCCGPVQCVIEEDGSGRCDGGSVCKSLGFTWECGNTVIQYDKKCKCGDDTLSFDDYRSLNWCCPGSEICEYKDGGAECSNGIVMQDTEIACNRT